MKFILNGDILVLVLGGIMLSIVLQATLIEFLSTPNKLVGIILAILGFALSILAKNITKVARKTDSPSNKDPLYLILLAFALCLIMVGMIITIF